MRCNRKECRYKRSIRTYSFFIFHPNIPASILIKNLELFIISKNNAKQIYEILSRKILYSTILKVLENIRYTIANYLKDKYRKYQIGVDPSTNKIVALDECLILHDSNNDQIWLVGGIETK